MNRRQRRAEKKRSGAPPAGSATVQSDFAAAIAHHQAGRITEAVSLYRALLRRISGSAADGSTTAAVYYNLGGALQTSGKMDDAIACFRAALVHKPDLVHAHYNLGTALESTGNVAEAAECYRRALAHEPDYAEAHYNLGTIHEAQGNAGQAAECYRRAVACKPDLIAAHYNLGCSLTHIDPEAAIAAHREALARARFFPAATRNLAALLSGKGDHGEAADVLMDSLRIKETPDAAALFVEVVQHLQWSKNHPDMRRLMIKALMEPWGRPYKLVGSAISLLFTDPAVAACVTGAAQTPDVFATPAFERTAADSLFRALLVSAPIGDMRVERFLTAARGHLLHLASTSAAVSEAVLEFFCALAGQCFITEYVYDHTDDEVQTVDTLWRAVGTAVETDAEVPVLSLVAIACFRPLGTLPSAERLISRRWPKAVADLLVQHVSEPAAESVDRASIPRLTDTDPTSQAVQEQYEENPYPRWVRAVPVLQPQKFAAYLATNFPTADWSSFASGNIRTLIAGCGTGQHAIEHAVIFSETRVTAIDLSLKSLGYARRKTRELGLSSLEYAQADLLRLDGVFPPFDVIESVGTLHHLADPWEGWRSLLKLLRPGGVMKVGLYGAVARRSINRVRQVIAERGWSAAPDDIRRARQELALMEDNGELKDVARDDFYYLSGCRDLYFHTQEQTVTLADIAAFLRANGLAFLGFDVGLGVLFAYSRMFPNDPARTNLAQWETFENANPRVFMTLYQFWVQKGESADR